MLWTEICDVARAQIASRKLPEIYNKRLEFELSEITKQAANQVWTDIINSDKTFQANPNNLLLPWLFDKVQEDPVAKLGGIVITSSKHRDVAKFIATHGDLPSEMVLDPDKPDIDIDCLPHARDAIKAYAAEKYSGGVNDGFGTVCSVSTWMTYLLRQAIQDVAKATVDLGEGWCTKSEAIQLTTSLPDEVDEMKDDGYSTCKGKIRVGDTETECGTKHKLAKCPKCQGTDTEGPTIGKLIEEHQVLRDFYNKYPKVIDMAVRLVGRIRAMGKHAGALIIADRPLFGNIPMHRRAGSEEWVSIWSEGRNPQLSKYGYTKWDLLGIKNLHYINECCRMIFENHGFSFGENLAGWRAADPDQGYAGYYIDREGNKVYMYLDDPVVLQTANDLKTDAVFQFDTDLAKSILSNGVRSFKDLMVANALGHPGPMACVRAGTPVTTDDGQCPIENLDNETHRIAYLDNDGQTKYTSQFCLGKSARKKIYLITLANGTKLPLSGDHFVLTPDGFRQVKDLTTNDSVINVC